MENTSNSLGDGDLSAPTSAAGFGLEDQSSTMPSMPTMMAATGSPDPVSLVSEGSTVFKEEPSPSQPPAQALGAAPSPDEQVLHHGLAEEFNLKNSPLSLSSSSSTSFKSY